MMQILRGQLSKITGIHIETIRYYEKFGLIPEPEKNESGYRVYTKDIVGRLSFIKLAKDCGFSLHEVKKMLYLVDHCEDPHIDADSILKAKVEELGQRLENINSMITLLVKVKGLLKQNGCSFISTLLDPENNTLTL